MIREIKPAVIVSVVVVVVRVVNRCAVSGAWAHPENKYSGRHLYPGYFCVQSRPRDYFLVTCKCQAIWISMLLWNASIITTRPNKTNTLDIKTLSFEVVLVHFSHRCTHIKTFYCHVTCKSTKFKFVKIEVLGSLPYVDRLKEEKCGPARVVLTMTLSPLTPDPQNETSSPEK